MSQIADSICTSIPLVSAPSVDAQVESDHPPYLGGSDHPPYLGGSDHPPYLGGSDHPPYLGGLLSLSSVVNAPGSSPVWDTFLSSLRQMEITDRTGTSDSHTTAALASVAHVGADINTDDFNNYFDGIGQELLLLTNYNNYSNTAVSKSRRTSFGATTPGGAASRGRPSSTRLCDSDTHSQTGFGHTHTHTYTQTPSHSRIFSTGRCSIFPNIDSTGIDLSLPFKVVPHLYFQEDFNIATYATHTHTRMLHIHTHV
eukprot:GHVR01120121.1.p1 GENE.GHVR01120121.1~~GHVR01120121.1.p1  ORF type:complete len:256 (-),score=78.63 GHVR01120121.1:92-859(-)